MKKKLKIFFKFINLSRKGNSFLDYGNMAYEAVKNSFRPIRPYARIAKWKILYVLLIFYRIFVNASIVSLQMGICSVFYVFCGVHMKEVKWCLKRINFEVFRWIFPKRANEAIRNRVDASPVHSLLAGQFCACPSANCHPQHNREHSLPCFTHFHFSGNLLKFFKIIFQAFVAFRASKFGSSLVYQFQWVDDGMRVNFILVWGTSNGR